MMLKFKIDENLPVDVADRIKQAGFDCVSIYNQQMIGCSDAEIIEVCKVEGRVLLSLDLDFCDIRQYPPAQYPGIVVFRLSRQDLIYILEIVERIVPLFQIEELDSRLWIVDEKKVRIRS